MINIKLAFILLMTFAYAVSIAQPLSIKLKMKENESNYPLIIEAEPSAVLPFVEKNSQFKIGSQIGNFFTIYTDKLGVKLLYSQSWIKHISDGKFQMYPMLDSSRTLNNVDSVYLGNSPLSSNYRGRNILVGIIDFGIEWRHPDFKNGANDTRIIAIWDQNKDSIAPLGYSYGHLWTKRDIDSGLCTHYAAQQYGHGTNVAGIAVGNGSVLPQYRGIAPEAKIIAVSMKNNDAWLTNIIDGIHYIFSQADSLHMPCVINISVGTYDGSHDGRDIATRMMESTISQKGKAIVAAAGNSGHINQHIRFSPNNDTTYTDFIYTPAYGGIYFNFWSDTSAVRDLTIGIQADSPATLLPVSNPYFFDFKSRFLDSLIQYGYYEDSMVVRNQLDSSLGKAYFYVLKQENTVNFQCYIVPKNNSHLWRFSTTGKGIIDLWVNNSLQGSSNIYTGALPSLSTNPTISQYRLSDQTMSLTSGFQCSDKIITVGNYVNKFGIIDIDTIYRPIGGIQNEIASNSSKGPTRDGRLKPDICASGGQTMTTIDSITSYNFALNPSSRKKIGQTGKYSVGGGTSMSTPVVTGCVALLLEKYPSLGYQQILYLIKKTAKKDSYTTNSPNNTYGHGKINAFQLMSYPVTYGCKDTGSVNYNPLADFEDTSLCIKKIYGCTDTGSINFNPLANVDNGTCIKKVYGCTDSTATNYNPLANINDGSCIYPSTSIVLINTAKIKVFPIPTKNLLTIDFQSTRELNLRLISSQGRVVIIKKLKESSSIDLSHLSRGLYSLEINSEGYIEKIKILLE